MSPKISILQNNIIKGYILNVVGTDQIHDFCNIVRLEQINKNKFPTGGAQICFNIPDKDEFVEMQCLETFHVFLETILSEGIIYNEIKKTTLIGGGRFKGREYKQTNNICSFI